MLPSFVAYLLFIRGVELVGAGHSMHLMPLDGTIMSPVFLREEVKIYPMNGIASIAGRIILASFRLTHRNSAVAARDVP